MFQLKKPKFVPEIEQNSIIQEEQKFFIYNGFKVPKEFGWWIVLMELSKMKNVELEIIYDSRTKTNKPGLFTLDGENCIAPREPLIVNVYKVKRYRVKHGYERIFGKRYSKSKEKIITIRNMRGLDPNPAESLNMIKALL